MKIAKRSEKGESKNRPVATNFQFLKILAPLGQLAAETDDTPHSRARSQLAFALLCELSGADRAAPALPPLVQEAMEDIRANYAGLYGVEELSERLGCLLYTS